MSKIAILGAGRVGGTLAGALATGGHAITLANREGRTSEGWQGPPLAFATVADAIAQAEIVIDAMPGDIAVATLVPHADALSGKVLIDLANATTRGADGLPAGLAYPGSSLAHELQAALPATKVVKTLNTMLFPVMAKPALVPNANVFMSGDDDGAKQITRQLLYDLGWADEAIVDLGGVGSAQVTEAFILLVPFLLKTYGMKPFAMAIAR